MRIRLIFHVSTEGDDEREKEMQGRVIRKAFRMSVDPGHQAEYIRRHNPIWEDLERVLLQHGVITYSIFLDPATSDLFAYAEIESEERWAAIAATDACRRWWHTMRQIMPSNADGSPVSRDLPEVFHLDRE
jgi:L-rhamnose mutarotase